MLLHSCRTRTLAQFFAMGILSILFGNKKVGRNFFEPDYNSIIERRLLSLSCRFIQVKEKYCLLSFCNFIFPAETKKLKKSNKCRCGEICRLRHALIFRRLLLWKIRIGFYFINLLRMPVGMR